VPGPAEERDDGGVDPSPASDDSGTSTRGRLLVATPDLRDPNFSRSVVLVLEHAAEGALGVILNRPTDVRVAEALPDWAEVCAEPACLYLGGPVQPDAVIALGRPRDGAVPVGYRELGPGFGTVDLDAAVDPFAGVRVFVGYAGWGPGQLDGELAAGGWIVVDREQPDALTSDPSNLWRAVLRRQPGRISMFALAPEDPSVN
jgi:putative transcriptional regulator